MAAESGRKKLLVIQVAALGYDFVQRHGSALPASLTFEKLEPVFPAVTCAVQAAMRTGCNTSSNGIPGNGYLERTLMKPLFWEQSAAQVEGPRIWDAFRAAGGTVGMLFWQQSLGESVDLLLSPAPIHKHHGGMIQNCYSKPDGLYKELCNKIGRAFNLMDYWGPLASTKSSAWTAEATSEVMKMDLAPDLLFTYLSGMDYDLQRFGPTHKKSLTAFYTVSTQIERLLSTAQQTGYEVLIFGDYAIRNVQKAAFPNRILREAGLMKCREISGMLYPDLYQSQAFVVVDHEVAHVYVKDPSATASIAELFRTTEGVKTVLCDDAKTFAGIDHSRTGDIVLIAADGFWFAYPWWHTTEKEPDYASHVDIHNKPGFDPCELFFGWPPLSISRNTSRVKGSHGVVTENTFACWASTIFPREPLNQLELAHKIRKYFES